MSPEDAARALFPEAVLMGAISELLLAAVLGLALSSLALFVLKPHPRKLNKPWPARARLTWPARKGAAVVQLFVPALVGATVALLGGPLVPWSTAWGIALLTTVAWTVAWVPRLRFERGLHPQPEKLRGLAFLRGRFVFLTVMYGHLLGLLALALAQGLLPTWALVATLPSAIALVLGWTWGWGLRLVEVLGMARDAPPELVEIVRERAARLGLEPRSVKLLDWEAANAFAFPLPQALAFTQGALEALDRPQLAGVTDHELGHLAESRAVIWARTLGSMAWVPLVAAAPAHAHFGWFGVVALLPLALGAGALLARLRRRMEERADAHAHAEDGATYARALEALYRQNRAPAVLGQGPHPDLVDRMRAAGLEPDWPVPDAPSKWASHSGVLVVCVASMLLAPLRVGVLVLSWAGGPATGLWGGPEWLDLAWSRPTAEARVLFEAALERHPDNEEAMAGRMQTLAGLGLCEEAWEQSAAVPEWWVEPWEDLRERCPPR